MFFKLLILFAFAAVSLAIPQYDRSNYAPVEPLGHAKYDFEWAVEDPPSRNNFGQTEVRDGEDTRGSYYVLLPDGRTQKVFYHVSGDSGYVAEVTYVDEPHHYQPQPLPSHGAYN